MEVSTRNPGCLTLSSRCASVHCLASRTCVSWGSTIGHIRQKRVRCERRLLREEEAKKRAYSGHPLLAESGPHNTIDTRSLLDLSRFALLAIAEKAVA